MRVHILAEQPDLQTFHLLSVIQGEYGNDHPTDPPFPRGLHLQPQGFIVTHLVVSPCPLILKGKRS